jgi:uncharacterized membrane protein YeaQ/YmgE (transglycosylase-associated protein family)
LNWIVLLIVGGVIGWLASLLMKTDAQMGWVANIVVGIAGAALGGWLAPQLGITEQGFMVYVVAVGGAVLLIAILKILRVFK